MSSSLIQLLVLAGVAVFLILKLKNVLGTREGFEKPTLPADDQATRSRKGFEVIEGGPDHDIIDHVAADSAAAKALAAMKRAEPGFAVMPFLQGARGAYEMILMGFEKGNIEELRPFLSNDVYETFHDAVQAREEQGLTLESKFVGLREMVINDAKFDETTKIGEITMRFVGELTTVVRNKAGEVIEGSTTEIKRQRDIWTFARQMGGNNPNWQLVATGE